MSLLELIAQRALPVADGFQLSDLLAETALVALAEGHDVQSRPLIARHFARVLMEDDAASVDTLVSNLLEHNVPLGRVLNHYIPEVARLLGTMWEDDEANFSQVTQACGRLLRLTQDLGAPRPMQPVPALNRPRILLIRPETETHFLGLMIASAQLRSDGWLVKMELSGDAEVVTRTLTTDVFDIVGFTIGTDRTVDTASGLIKTIRDSHTKAPLAIGGQLVGSQPGTVSALGVDIAVNPIEKIGSQLRELLPVSAD